eukprot:scaffold756_cov281-Pinguiococcus_pyrenoidosus.AAC.3
MNLRALHLPGWSQIHAATTEGDYGFRKGGNHRNCNQSESDSQGQSSRLVSLQPRDAPNSRIAEKIGQNKTCVVQSTTTSSLLLLGMKALSKATFRPRAALRRISRRPASGARYHCTDAADPRRRCAVCAAQCSARKRCDGPAGSSLGGWCERGSSPVPAGPHP